MAVLYDALQAVVSGTALSGVAVSLLRVVTKASLPDTVEGLRRSAGMLFIIISLWLSYCSFRSITLSNDQHSPLYGPSICICLHDGLLAIKCKRHKHVTQCVALTHIWAALQCLCGCRAGVYFAASAFVCAVCFLLYACILPRLAFVQFHRKKSKASVQSYIMQPPAHRRAPQLQGSSAESDSKDDADKDGALTEQEVQLTQKSHNFLCTILMDWQRIPCLTCHEKRPSFIHLACRSSLAVQYGCALLVLWLANVCNFINWQQS